MANKNHRIDLELDSQIYISHWHVIIRRFPLGTRCILFNPTTLVSKNCTPADNAISTTSTTSTISNKYFYYEKRKCLVSDLLTTLMLLVYT